MSEMNKLGILLTAFIVIIIGVVLVSPISDMIQENQNRVDQYNETLTIAAGAGTLSLCSDCDYVSLIKLQNGTGDYDTNAFNITSAGAVVTNESAGSYDISYVVEPALYVSNGTARTLMGLVIIFFVLGIVGIGFVLVKKMDLF